MNNKKYFLAEDVEANRFENAGGRDWEAATADDNLLYGATGEADIYAAIGTGAIQTVDASKPFIFTLTNTGSITGNVSFLQAIYALGQGNNGVTLGVTCTCGNVGVDYATFLRGLQSTSYYINTMYLQCDTQSQLLVAISIVYKNLKGDSVTQNVYPTIDPNQQQNGIVTVACSFILNYYTLITFASLTSANALTIRLYTSKENDSTRNLLGTTGVKDFSAPVIRRAMPTKSV